MGMRKDTGKQKDYVSYMLRMWQDSSDEESPRSIGTLWRASLQSPHTGERVSFASLDELYGFLQRQTGVVPDTREGQDVGQERGSDDSTTKQSHTLS